MDKSCPCPISNGMTSTLIITTKNEIEGMRALMPKIPFREFDEVILIDLDSTDGTLEYAQTLPMRIVHQRTRGRGNAVRLAAETAKGDILCFFAPDGNEDPSDIVKLRNLILAGNDMAIASRFLKDSRNEEDGHWWRPRAWANRAFTLSVRLFWGGHISDTINGFRAVTKKAVLEMHTTEPGFAIEFQMSIRALKLKQKVAEITTTEGDRIGGASTAYSIPTGLRVLSVLLRELWLGKRFLAKRYP